MSCTFSSCMFRASCKMYTLNMYFLMKYCLLFSSSKSGILNREELLVKILHETCTTKKCTTSKNLSMYEEKQMFEIEEQHVQIEGYHVQIEGYHVLSSYHTLSINDNVNTYTFISTIGIGIMNHSESCRLYLYFYLFFDNS